MPYKEVWVEPERVLLDFERDVQVVRTYKSDRAGEALSYTFLAAPAELDRSEESLESGAWVEFDARTLIPFGGYKATPAQALEMIKAAVAAGRLTSRGPQDKRLVRKFHVELHYVEFEEEDSAPSASRLREIIEGALARALPGAVGDLSEPDEIIVCDV